MGLSYSVQIVIHALDLFSAAYQQIDSATHPVVTVFIPYDLAVIQQPAEELFDEIDKRDAGSAEILVPATPIRHSEKLRTNLLPDMSSSANEASLTVHCLPQLEKEQKS